jgi:protein phosphatase
VRANNQDALLDAPQKRLWAVADGMGGHACGELASQLVIERLSTIPTSNAVHEGVEQIQAALAAANRQLVEDAALTGVGLIGSTAAVLMIYGWSCIAAWVGDSRVYRLRDGRLSQLTSDHTEVQEMVRQGRLSSEEAEQHPRGNILLRAVGAEDALIVDHCVSTVAIDDRYLLCSDGLTKELLHEQIQEILTQTRLADCARRLVDAACEARGRDNVTAVVVDCLASERR